MRIDLDTYREILDTLTRNKSRSFLTGFGVFWGVFMLVGLMGGGAVYAAEWYRGCIEHHADYSQRAYP